MAHTPAPSFDVSIVTRLRMRAWDGVILHGEVVSPWWLAYAGIGLLHLVTGLVFVFNSASGQVPGFHSLPLDEAWVRMVYARSFADNFAFHYNPGTAEAGFTSPLWVVLVGAFYKVFAFTGVTLPAIAKLLGIAFAIGSSIVGLRLVRGITGSPGLGVVAAVIIALEPGFAFAKVAGLEVSLFAFVALGAAAAFYHGRLKLTGVMLALAVAARPEGFLLVILTVVALALKVLWERGDLRLVPKADLLDGAKVAGPAVLAGLLVAIFYNTVNGTPYPNSYLVAHFPMGLFNLPNLWNLAQGYLFQTSFLAPSVMAATVTLLVLASIRYLRHRRFAALPLLAFPVVLFYGLSVSLPLGPQPWDIASRRYLDASLPFLAVGLVVGTYYANRLLGGLGLTLRQGVPNRLWSLEESRLVRFRSGSDTAKWFSLLLTLLFVLLAIMPYVRIPRDLVVLGQDYSWNSRNLNEVSVAAASWIDQNLPADSTIGVVNGGALRFFGNRRVVDLSGVNTHTAIGKPILEAAEAEGVDFLVAFRNIYFDSWPLGQEVFSWSTNRNTILDGAELVVYQADWDRPVQFADKGVPQTVDVSQLRLLDSLDVGHQTQEEAHFYALSQPSTVVERIFHIAKEEGVGVNIKDEARTSTGVEQFVVKSVPGRPLIVVKRYDAAVGGALAVYVDNQFVGDWELAVRDFVFGEDTFLIAAQLVIDATTELRFEHLPNPNTTLNSFYYWIYTIR